MALLSHPKDSPKGFIISRRLQERIEQLIFLDESGVELQPCQRYTLPRDIIAPMSSSLFPGSMADARGAMRDLPVPRILDNIFPVDVADDLG